MTFDTVRITTITRPLAAGLFALGACLGPASVAAAAPFGEVTLPAGLRPEGITAGPGTTFYAGSLADGRIVRGDLRDGEVAVLLAGQAGRSIRGLDHDTRSGLVWAVGNAGAVAHLWAVDERTGAVAVDVEVPGGQFLNDLVVTRGAVYVTDSRVDRLAVLALGPAGRPTSGAASLLPLSGEWPLAPAGAFNANGIRELPDGSLVLNNSRVGGLWRVDPKTGVTQQIPVLGGPGIVAGDGLDLRGQTLINVRGSGANQVAVLDLRRGENGWTAHWQGALTDPRLDVPSTAVIVGNEVWAVNARFGNASPGTADYWVTPLRLN